MQLTFNRSDHAGTTTLCLTGEVDLNNVDDLIFQLTATIAGGAHDLVVDLDGVSYLDWPALAPWSAPTSGWSRPAACSRTAAAGSGCSGSSSSPGCPGCCACTTPRSTYRLPSSA